MVKKLYSYGFLVPAAIVYTALFLVPTVISFFFSMTWWTLTEWKFIGFENFVTFLSEPSLSIGIKNTLIYAVLTCGFKLVLAVPLAAFLCTGIRTKGYLRSVVFFPNLLSTIAVGYTFSSLMHPTKGVINVFLKLFGVEGPDWLGNVHLALYSVIGVDVWKGVGVATVIMISGITAISSDYYEAAQIDGANAWQRFRYITLPLARPAMNSVIILALIGGLRTFDLVWAMTGGGPGFATELLSSVVYKQYAASFYGLSTAGNVILFIVISVIAFPLYRFLSKGEAEL